MADSPLNPGDMLGQPTTGPDDGAPLGAAATLPGGGSKRGGNKADSSSSGGRRRRRFPAGVGAIGLIVLCALLALVPMTISALVKTPRDRIGISYGGGPIEGSHFQRIVKPGSPLFFNGFFDQLYLYPSDQRSYIISNGTDAKGKATTDAIVAPSRDRVQVSYQVAMYYKLNTNRLRAFHEELGLRYQAYTQDGWDRLNRETFRQQVESAIQQETRRYDVADLYGNTEALQSVQESVQRALGQRLRIALGQQFFCGPDFKAGGRCTEVAFVIKRLDLPPNVVTAFESNRTSEIAIKTKTNEIAQREAEAKAIEALNAALAASGDKYVLLKAIESGSINFWVLPSDSGLTLQTPSGAAGGAAPTAPTAGN